MYIIIYVYIHMYIIIYYYKCILLNVYYVQFEGAKYESGWF